MALRIAVHPRAPEYADHVAALEQHEIERQFRNVAGGEADHEKPALPRDRTQRRLGVAPANRIVDDIDASVGGRNTEPALRSIAWQGRFLVVGFAAGDIPKLPLNLVLLKGCDVVGVFWGSWMDRDPQAHAANMADILRWAAEGKLSA